jgi:hypothetical protein
MKSPNKKKNWGGDQNIQHILSYLDYSEIKNTIDLVLQLLETRDKREEYAETLYKDQLTFLRSLIKAHGKKHAKPIFNLEHALNRVGKAFATRSKKKPGSAPIMTGSLALNVAESKLHPDQKEM